MTGARFVHDRLEELGWDVLIADAAKVKGLAPLACKTDKIDARVLAVLSHRDLVPEIWLPDPSVRREREHSSSTRCRCGGIPRCCIAKRAPMQWPRRGMPGRTTTTLLAAATASASTGSIARSDTASAVHQRPAAMSSRST
jgi:hypothetical protein